MGSVPVWAADVVAVTVVTAGGAWLGLWQVPRWVRAAARRLRRTPPAPPVAPPPRQRPVEELAAHARRLGGRFHQPPNGRSFAKLEGIRRAYDDVLAECCEALGLDHLLHVLEPGDELDLERARVEARLEHSGLVIRVRS